MPPEPLARVIHAASGLGPVDRLVHVLERLAPWPRGRLAILTYHRVDRPDARPELWPALRSATPDGFAEQLAMLTERYRPVTLEEVLAAGGEPRRLPRRAVLVTVDDAYADVATVVWPIARRVGVPVTLFVPTAFPDSGRAFWWDRVWSVLRAAPATDALPTPAGPQSTRTETERLAAGRRVIDWAKTQPHEVAMAALEEFWRGVADEPGHPDPAGADRGRTARPPDAVLDWATLRRLSAEGLTLAPHTRTHPLLDRVPFATAVEEIEGSVADLETRVGPVPRVLAYPSGAHGGAAVEAARTAGMVLAVTTERGGNDLASADPLRLRRINVGGRTRSALLAAQLVRAGATAWNQR